MSDLDTSGGGSEDDEEEGGGTAEAEPPGEGVNGLKGMKRRKKGGKGGEEDGDVVRTASTNKGYSRSDCFKVEKSLLIYG